MRYIVFMILFVGLVSGCATSQPVSVMELIAEQELEIIASLEKTEAAEEQATLALKASSSGEQAKQRGEG
ncbi:MAG TPA: hypothetical protein VIR63_00775 [Pontiella sp.]